MPELVHEDEHAEHEHETQEVSSQSTSRQTSDRSILTPRAISASILARPCDRRCAPRASVATSAGRCASIVRSITSRNGRERRAGPPGSARPPLHWRRSARPAGCAPASSARYARPQARETRPCPARRTRGVRRASRSSDGSGAAQRSGIRERVLNRQPHVGHAELRDDRSVDELDHRVHDRLRMDRRRRSDRRATPNSQCASITSSPLFISVAESIVILRPICHVGCLQRVGGGHVRQLRRRAGRETVRPTRSARAASPRPAPRPCRH